MAVKVLGQLAPSANSYTPLYVVPAGKTTTVSSLTVCNPTAAPLTFRVRVAVNGATDAIIQSIYHDVTVPANDTFTSTIGLTLGAGDALRAFNLTAGLIFAAFGNEV